MGESDSVRPMSWAAPRASSGSVQILRMSSVEQGGMPAGHWPAQPRRPGQRGR